MTHREIHNPSPGGLIVLKVEEMGLVPAPAVCYERYADCASLEEPPRPHLVHMLQTKGKMFSSHGPMLHGQSARARTKALHQTDMQVYRHSTARELLSLLPCPLKAAFHADWHLQKRTLPKLPKSEQSYIAL